MVDEQQAVRGAQRVCLKNWELPLSGLSAGGLSLELELVAEFGCESTDNAELSGLRQQFEVVCLGLAFDFAVNFVGTVAPSPIMDGLPQFGEGCDGRHVQVS